MKAIEVVSDTESLPESSLDPNGDGMRNETDLELAEDLVWGDHNEEQYLRQILSEQNNGDIIEQDSLLGQSTVEDIFAKKRQRKARHGRDNWTGFAPIASSVTTVPDPEVPPKNGGGTESISFQPCEDTVVQPQPDAIVDEDPRPTNPQFLEDGGVEGGEFTVESLPNAHAFPGVVNIVTEDGTMAIDEKTVGVSTLSDDTLLYRIVQPKKQEATLRRAPAHDVIYGRSPCSPAKESKEKNLVHPASPTKTERTESSDRNSSSGGLLSDDRLSCLSGNFRVFRLLVCIATTLLVVFLCLSAMVLARSDSIQN